MIRRKSAEKPARRTSHPSSEASWKHISENWIEGRALHREAVSPIVHARNELPGWSDASARKAWEQLYALFREWQEPSDEVEPWLCAGISISDSIDLLIKLDQENYPPLKAMYARLPLRKLIAVIVLRELALGDHKSAFFDYDPIHRAACNNHIVAAIKGEKYLLVVSYENFIDAVTPYVRSAKGKATLLQGGRKLGAIANKEKAARRSKGLQDAAMHYFKDQPNSTYPDCIHWLQNEPALKSFVSYGKGKRLSASRIEKIITGTKELALQTKEYKSSVQT